MATQLMQVKLVNSRGEIMLLPETLALDGWPSERELPGVEIQGKSGRVVDLSLASARPRTVRVVGSISGVDKDDADRIREQIAGFVMRANPLRLYRYQGSDRYMLCNAKAVDHSYITGRFGGRIFNLSIMFEAADPFLYADTLTKVEANPVVFTPPLTLLEANNPGSVSVAPVIWLHGSEVGGKVVTNPKLSNYATGTAIKYNGVLGQDEVLILDTAKHSATKLANNTDNAGVAQGGGLNYIILSTEASAEDGRYVGQIIKLLSGTGSGQHQKIVGYNGASKVATVTGEWNIIPDSTTEYEIYHLASLKGFYISETMLGDFSGPASALNDMNTEYLMDGFQLTPGLNQIEVEDENQLVGVSILFRARWH